MTSTQGPGLLLLRRVVDALASVCAGSHSVEPESAVVLYHASRALSIARATSHLVEGGYGREAMVINRSLLNLLINLAWLTSGYSAARIQWFIDCEILSRRAGADALHRTSRISDSEHQRLLRGMQADWDNFCRKYGYTWHDKKPPSRWAPQLRDMAYSLKEHSQWCFLWRDYEISYRFLSSEEHTDPRAVIHHLERTDADCFIAQRPQEDGTLLVETCRYAIAVLVVAAPMLAGAVDLDTLRAQLGELQTTYRT